MLAKGQSVWNEVLINQTEITTVSILDKHFDKKDSNKIFQLMNSDLHILDGASSRTQSCTEIKNRKPFTVTLRNWKINCLTVLLGHLIYTQHAIVPVLKTNQLTWKSKCSCW